MNEAGTGVESPCIRRCCLDDDDVCLGCFRRLDEITRWSEAGDTERHHILRLAEARKNVYEARLRNRRRKFSGACDE